MHNLTWKATAEALIPLYQELHDRGGSITDAHTGDTEDMSEALDAFYPIEAAWYSAWVEWCATGNLVSLPPASNRLGYIHVYASMQTADTLARIYPHSFPTDWNVKNAFNWLKELNAETVQVAIDSVRNDFLGVTD